MLPSVVNLFRYIVPLEYIFIVNPLQLAPAETVLACSLSYVAEQDVVRAEMLNSNFKVSPAGYFLMSSPHSLRQQIKNQTETDISIRANEKSVSNHWPEPGTNLQ